MFKIVALEDISIGTMLTIFYPATEWDMIDKFQVAGNLNGSPQWIQGAFYLDLDTLLRLSKDQVAPHILKKKKVQSLQE